jgi:peptidoglycan hydrolase-like protein with peptidoglycan-binding domain
LAALAAWHLLSAPRVSAVTPGPDAWVKSPSPMVTLDVKGLAKLEDVRVSFDGRDITGAAWHSGERLTFATGKLADGAHAVVFSGRSSNLFRRQLRKDWRFTVDTSVPTLELGHSAGEGRINTSPPTFSGTTEPYAEVAVTVGSVTASGTADASGEYAVSAPLPDGPSEVTIAASDRAGNVAHARLRVYVDAIPPTLKTTHLASRVGHAGLKIRIKALDQLGAPEVKVVLDGELRAFTGAVTSAVFRVANLAQGEHVLVITASDGGGNLVTERQRFVIDSTEHFGSATLWPGARGKDVRELQKRLSAADVFRGTRNGVFDRRTVAAVESFQEKFGLDVDGKVGGRMLTALSGQIVVDLGDLRLYLFRDGRLVKSYSVAAGQAAYPTPTGTYAVTSMQMNPTWYPPNSDWAKDAEPIPPGVTNPLGTRWIGTSAPGVGIHGTPDDASVGSYASHGCIRMHIPEVEDLYTRVVVGMPVVIRP